MSESQQVHDGPLPNGGSGGMENILRDGGAVQVMARNYQGAIAVQRPRSLVDVEKRVLIEADLMGEAGFYAWGTGKDAIEGPSVELAMVLARNWGNCVVADRGMVETPTKYLFTAAFIDLETGTAIERPFGMSKRWTVYGKMDAERKDDIRFQIGASKAQRNVILRSVPSWLVDKAMARCKAGVLASVQAFVNKQGWDNARKALVDQFMALGVDQARVEQGFGKVTTEWGIEELVQLRALLAALKRGSETVDGLFPKPDEPPAAPAGESKPTDTAVADMKPGDASRNSSHDASAPKPELFQAPAAGAPGPADPSAGAATGKTRNKT